MVRRSCSDNPVAFCKERKFVSVLNNDSLPDVEMMPLCILTRAGSHPSFRNSPADYQNKSVLSSSGDLNFPILTQAASHVALIVADISAEVGLSLKQSLCHAAVEASYG